jgi:hypothetical protein
VLLPGAIGAGEAAAHRYEASKTGLWPPSPFKLGIPTEIPHDRTMTFSQLPQTSDHDMAILSAAVYDNDKMAVGKWTRVFDPGVTFGPDGVRPTTRIDPVSGFKAAVFSDGENYVLAFAGSERHTGDWLTNLGQGIGLDTKQYGQAAAFAKDCKAAFGDKLTMTGHSLGGGLAVIGAAVSNCPAVTFNPAGVHDKTLKRLGVDPTAFREVAEQGLVRKYVVQGEIVDRIHRILPLPDAPGHRIELDGAGKNTFSKHKIGVVIQGLDAMLKARAASEQANAFRTMDATDGLRQHPELSSAYKMLGAMEAKASTMGKAAGDQFVSLARAEIAGRIERGDKIPPLPAKERITLAKAVALEPIQTKHGQER